MSTIQIITFITYGATVFALIVGIFSVWNGRRTRKEITDVILRMDLNNQNLIRETQNLIRETQNETRKILEKVYEKVA